MDESGYDWRRTAANTVRMAWMRLTITQMIMRYNGLLHPEMCQVWIGSHDYTRKSSNKICFHLIRMESY